MGSNDSGAGASKAVLGAGSAANFRVEFAPTSHDGRFGVFQLYVEGLPLGDGTTTAFYPHYQDLQGLCALAERPGARKRERLNLGDTFDHLHLFWELTEADVVFTFTTRPQWGAPPSWTPPAGEQVQVGVARPAFISTWREAERQFRRLMTLG